MQITLHRKVRAVCYQAVATIKIEQERRDIQQALEQASTDAASLPIRLINYLEKENLLDNQVLTELGEQVRKTGLLSAAERGIYRLWYLDDDEAIGTLPLLLQRETEPVKGDYRKRTQFYNWQNPQRLGSADPRHCDAKDIYVVGDCEQEKKNTRDLKLEVINAGSAAQCVDMDLTFNFSLLRDKSYQASFKLEGDLPYQAKSSEKRISLCEEFDVAILAEIMPAIGASLGHIWDEEYKRMRTEVPEHKKPRGSFITTTQSLSNLETCYGRFEGGEVKQLPLMPTDEQVAKDWQGRWLNDLYQEAYYSEEQSNYRQQLWLSHPAIKDFKLGTKTGESLLQALDRQQNPVSFWHASAAQYLIPSNTKTPLPSIRFKKDEALEVGDLLRSLILNETVHRIIYSDRHYKSAKHKRNIQEIARLSGAVSGHIFTTDNSVKIPENWLKTTMRNSGDNHDRYWIMMKEHKTFIWTASTSLDFIDFSNANNRVNSDVTFTQLDVKDLPDYLQKAVANVEDREVLA